MNKIIMEEEVLYIEDSDVLINIEKDVKVKVFHLIKDKSVDITVNLNHENSEIEYYFSTINYNNNKISVNINHNKKKTISNIYTHGININDNKLDFSVNGFIPKEMDESICNQENQIINLNNGKSTICPNLFIDCYNCESNHSAYIGTFNKDILFYLNSRGINNKKATKLLIENLLIPNSIDKDKIKDYLELINNI